ncbi:MAG: sulfotransferase domain-containing protein [Sumerlaeia bacterium]
MLPNVVLLGAPKCGTTAFHDFFDQHPDIFTCKTKENHLFLGNLDGPMGVEALGAYSEFFRAGSEKKIRVESCVWYLYNEQSGRKIRELIPQAKLLAFIRQPVERAYSMHSMNRRLGFEQIESFAEALAQEPLRAAHGCEQYLRYIDTGYYAQQLKRYYSLFPREQIKVVLFEDLKTQGEEILQELYDFMGLERMELVNTQKQINVTKVPKNESLYRYIRNSGAAGQTIKKMLPTSIRNSLESLFLEQIPKLNPERRLELTKKYYHDEILELQELLGRPLNRWLE